MIVLRDHKPGTFARLRGDTNPQLTSAAERLAADRRERQHSRVPLRETLVEIPRVIAFLAVAIALPRLFAAELPPAMLTVALILAFALVARVEFDVGAGFTIPTQILFVPVLFLIDPAWAPLVVAGGLVLARLKEIVRDRTPARILVATGNAWYAIGPAVVLSLADAHGASWDRWPIYLLALASQFVVDTAVSAAREWLVLGVRPRLHVRMFGLVFFVDVLLTPIGLLAAVVSKDDSFAFLLVLPLAALLRVFARERSARIDQAIELSAAYRGTAFLLGEVIVADDEYTGEHSYGVIALSLEIADELGLNEDDRRLVEFGALLHDVGKIAVPKAIVNKPGPLDDEEWKVMRQHTVTGQRMLDKVGGSMTEVGVIVRASHERWDGNGYPDGIGGEEVPLPARIVSVADTFHAITTTRPYRTAQSAEAAVKELRACAGTQFDPEVVEALVRVLERPAAGSPAEFFERVAHPEPPNLRVVRDPVDPVEPDEEPDIERDKTLEAQLKNLF